MQNSPTPSLYRPCIRIARAFLIIPFLLFSNISSAQANLVSSQDQSTRNDSPASISNLLLGLHVETTFSREAVQTQLNIHLSDIPVRITVKSIHAQSPGDRLQWAQSQFKESSSRPVLWLVPTKDKPGHLSLYYWPNIESRVFWRDLSLQGNFEADILALSIVIRNLVHSLDRPSSKLAEELPTEFPTAAPSEHHTPIGPQQMRTEPRSNSSSSLPPSSDASTSPPSSIRFRRQHSSKRLPVASLFVAYAGSSLSNTLMWQNGLAIGADFRISRGLFSGITLMWQAFQTISGTLPLRIMRVPAAIRFGFRLPLGRRIRMDFQGVGSFEYFTWKAPPSISSAIRSGAPGSSWRIALGPGIGLNIRLYSGLEILVRSHVNFWLANTSVLSQDQHQNLETLVYPHTASLGLLSGLAYSF